jgi:hypothetical protein
MNSKGEDTNLLVFRIYESHLSHLVISCTRRTQIKENGTVTSAEWHARQTAKVSCKIDYEEQGRKHNVYLKCIQ